MLPTDPGASSIVVAVRVRPFTIREAAQLAKTDDGTLFLGDGSLAAAPAPKLNQKGLRSVIKVVDDRCLVFDPPEDNPVQKFSRSVVPATGKRVKDQVFAFDRIFDDNASQMDVYEGTTKGLLDSVLDGYNATVFAYGATGCGKTHTITGTAQQPGIIFMTMQELFEKISERSDDKVTELSLSYLEIYNETIRDLLVPGGSKQGLMLREDTNQAVTVAGLTSHHPRDVQEVMDMIVQGNEFRTVSPTEANAVSSRSHAVLQINVAQRDRNASVNEPHTMATLSIIDLAGSERASATKNRGERLLEGANINKSLLALGGCINALCDPRKKNHVPYRNSKLTRLLKFSLGGNCKTVMIVCVSPSSAHFDETQNTLRYANRAKNIQTKVTRNVFNVNRHVKDFLVKIDEQMALINELKAQQKDAENAFGLKVRKQLDKRDLLAREGVQRIRVAYENALAERQQKVSDMKKLRTVERRLATLTAWADAFDLFGEQRRTQLSSSSSSAGEADADAAAPAELPPALAAMRKTARGIMAELEHSRHHLHQKIERSNWERPVDSALQHSIAQMASAAVDSVAAADTSESIASLTREAALLKANFAREANIEVLEQEKTTGSQTDMLMLRTLLSAQFEMMASLASTLAMPRDQAVAHGQRLVRTLLDASVAATSQIVKPDPSLSAHTAGAAGTAGVASTFSASTSSSGRFSLGGMDAFPPSRRGTPRRTRSSMMGGATTSNPAPVRSSLGLAAKHLAATSPTRSSPRRRKVVSGAGRKSVSMPTKRTSASHAGSIAGSARRDSNASSSSFKRSVRWRDDETEAGTLADFEKTPQKFASPETPVAIVVDAPSAASEEQEQEEVNPAFEDTNAQPLPESSWSAMATVPEADEETPSPLTAHASPPSPELPPLALPSYLSRTDLVETDEDDDSSLNAPDTSILPGAGMAAASAGPATTSSRFQAGFLSKSRPSLRVGGGGGAGYNSSSDAEHPTPPSLSASLNGTGAGARKSTPLRNMSLPRAANQQRTPPSATRIASLSSLHGSGSPKSRVGLGGIASVSSDSENQPPQPTPPSSSLSSLSSHPPTRLRSPSPRLSLSASNSDSETTTTLHDLPSTFDTNNLRSAIHSAKKAAAAAAGSGGGSGGAGHSGAFSSSVLLGSGGSGARRFSVGGAHHHGQHHGHHRASASYSGPHTLASSTNGISRQRRRSAERRRSPPIACSPLVSDSSSGPGGGHHHYRDGAVSRALTPGQARRMNMGGSLRLDSSTGGAAGSPRERERERERGRAEGKTAGAASGGMRRVTIGTAAMGGLSGHGLTNGHTNGHSSSGSIGGSARKDTSSRPTVAWR